MCWHAHSSNDGLLIRTALKKLLAVLWVGKVRVVPDVLSPARVFRQGHLQMRPVAPRERKGPNIDIGEDRQMFVRLVISEYLGVVF